MKPVAPVTRMLLVDSDSTADLVPFEGGLERSSWRNCVTGEGHSRGRPSVLGAEPGVGGDVGGGVAGWALVTGTAAASVRDPDRPRVRRTRPPTCSGR